MLSKQHWVLIVVAAVLATASYVAVAQQAPPQPMSFFVTSVGLGDGANLGGLAGADAHCQTLATAAGRGDSTWRAYLSTQGPGGVNARDRIGSGPWYANGGRRRVAQDLGELHGDTIDQARLHATPQVLLLRRGHRAQARPQRGQAGIAVLIR